ncbi:hypothetical protein F3Y22_tig00111213pilonHSYRG00677 [Hibiscus syriacus]|uniref:glucan endo-1,3-beta-D-glucosidase n=1 Tax=Hibiscus syriacus TaxID=106335 RepID=A0A6A2YVH1_HIBSY|nr:hypothetical protein F3Y22_tig00111213pilonHSYRG00677 [Hibiscus syriacus]
MTVTIPNGEIPNLNNVGAATAWVNTNIRPFHLQMKDQIYICYNSTCPKYVPRLTRFRVDYAKSFELLLLYLRETKSPLMINPYPYFELNVMENNVDYAFNSFLDNTFSALAVGYGDVDIVIGETGWPSVSDPGNFAAIIDNAASYNGHLIQKIVFGFGTPLMSNRTFDAYIFALFNEK